MEWSVLDWNAPSIAFYRRIGARPREGWIPAATQRRRACRAGRTGERDMAEQTFDLDRARRRPRRLCRRDPRRAARHEDRAGGARASRRHLPQLGLHPDQGAAAQLRDQPPAAHAGRLWLRRRQHPLRHRQDRQALPRGGEAALGGREAPVAEEQGHGVRRRRASWPARASSRSTKDGKPVADARAPAHHPGHRRPRPVAAGDGAGRQADLDLQGSDGAAGHAEVADRHRLRRDRHRIRQLLPEPRRRGDAGGGAGPRSCRSRTPRSAPSPTRPSRSRA